jgi:hypothetical protein
MASLNIPLVQAAMRDNAAGRGPHRGSLLKTLVTGTKGASNKIHCTSADPTLPFLFISPRGGPHTSRSFFSRAPDVGALIAANAPPLGFLGFQTLGGVYLLSCRITRPVTPAPTAAPTAAAVGRGQEESGRKCDGEVSCPGMKTGRVRVR